MDVKLSYYGNTNLFDISIKNGDLEMDDSFNTPLLVSLLTDARADESEVRKPENRRGWWGDEVSDDPTMTLGSKLWLLDQARILNNTTLRANQYAKIALSWLIKNNFSKIIDVQAQIIVTE